MTIKASISESGDIQEEFDFSALLGTARASINDQAISRTFYNFERMARKLGEWQQYRVYSFFIIIIRSFRFSAFHYCPMSHHCTFCGKTCLRLWGLSEHIKSKH
jgi:hypothetical protein